MKERHEAEARRGAEPRGPELSVVKGGLPGADVPGAPTPAVDAELVERARQGDSEAFEALVRRHLAAALASARPLVRTDEDAEDVCQDAFVRALERLEDCREPERFRSWLISIVRNRAHNVRKYQRRREMDDLETTVAAARDRPDRDLDQAELGRTLSWALAQLTEKQRAVVLLHDYEGWRHAEIGQRLGMSAGACRFSLHSARKRLRTLLADRGDGEWTP